MSTSSDRSVWESGNAYEPYIGRWSRLVAREFVDRLTIAPSARWLDVGCGTGALTQTILHHANQAGSTASIRPKAILPWLGSNPRSASSIRHRRRAQPS